MALTPKILSFWSTEFVPPEVYSQFGAVQSWWFVRPEVLRICQQLRDDFGKPVTVNNWNAGGTYKYSGFRPPKCTEGTAFSQHRLAAAADVKMGDYTADEVREHILKHKAKYMALGLTTLEHKSFAPTWCHFDLRPTGMSDILIVKP